MRYRNATRTLLAGLLIAACSSDSNGPSGTSMNATVQATPATVFDPDDVRIQQGGRVNFQFGSLGHNVDFAAASGVPSDIPGENINTTITRTFNTAGLFNYQCTIHPGMSGVVRVATSGGGGGGGGGYSER
ncbi:MAG: cupredoxin domain-containing protein [Gemmatimonadales bacterium]